MYGKGRIMVERKSGNLSRVGTEIRSCYNR